MEKSKYERCVLKVKAKLPEGCVEKKMWGKKMNGKTCYNPWAICAKTVGRPKLVGNMTKVQLRKGCEKGKIRNPKTNRCVLETGKVGKEVLKKYLR